MNQHLVSRVLLRRFSEHRNGPISGLDLDALTTRTDRVERFGSVRDLLPGDVNMEQVWYNEVEARLPHAFELLDQHQLLDDTTGIETVNKCIALHWARSFTMTEMIPSYKLSTPIR